MSFDLQLINNDLKIGPNGDIKTVTGSPKLRQDVIKIILTPLGAVDAHPWYGCAMDGNIVGKMLADTIVYAEIQSTINSSLDILKSLQVRQSTTQRVSLGEMISSVSGVTVEQDIEDPRKMNILVTIVTKKLEHMEELFTIIS